MSNKVIISADSTCDLPKEILEKYNIITTPLHVTLGEKTYDDLVNITPDEIYEYFEKTGKLPKTSAVNMQEYIDKFKPYIDEGYEIVHISIGGALSTSHQQSKLAAQELGNIYPVDSCCLSTGSGMLVLEAVEMLEKGMGAAEIAEAVKKLVPKVHGSFIVDKLDYLRAGGRCSTVAVLGANLLGIKPCIEINNADGSMTVGKKYRGKFSKVLNQYVTEKLADPTISKKRAVIIHAGLSDDILEAVSQQLHSRNYFDEILVARAGCTISCHCGPNTLGIMYMTE